MKTTTIAKLAAILVLMIGALAFASACSDSDEDNAGSGDDSAEHVDDTGDGGGGEDISDGTSDEHDDDADDHVDGDGHDDDAEAHDDGDDHDDGDAHDDDDAHEDVIEMSVSMTDQLTFEPSEIAVQAGQTVLMTIDNVGLALHDFTVAEMPVHVSHHDGDSVDSTHEDSHEHDDYALHMALDGGAVGTLEFTPEKAGVYEFHCTVPGHTEGGMIGTLTVTEA